MAAVPISTVGGTSVGYGGSISELSVATGAAFWGKTYGVAGANDWRVTAVSAGTREVQIAAGTGYGKGVQDTTTSAATVQLAAVTVAGTYRYDMIYAHRDWAGAGGTTSFNAMAATTAGDVPVGRAHDPGTLDDQPLAIFRMDYGSSVPVFVADLRVWQANGGAVAQDERVLQFLNEPGTVVRIGEDEWHRGVSSAGVMSWSKSTIVGVDLFAVGAAISGTPGAGAHFKMIAGTVIQPSNASGYGRITFPTAFPGGLLSVVVQNGDSSVTPDVGFDIAGGTLYGVGSRTDAVYRMWGPDGSGGRSPVANKNHRVDYIAIGW